MTAKPDKSVKNKNWSKVKIAGNLVTDDGGGLEGLIGLEMLEDYDIKTVLTDCFVLTPRQLVPWSDLEKESVTSCAFVVDHWVCQFENKNMSTKKRKRNNIENQIESDDERSHKKSKKPKKVKQKIAATNNDTHKISNSKPGQFVLLRQTTTEMDPIKSKENNTSSDDKRLMSEWKHFGLPKPILTALKDKGFLRPTPIQEKTLPSAISGRKDILGAAETGSGKTLAFGLPILNGILGLKGEAPLIKRKHHVEANSLSPIKKTKKRNERENRTPPPDELNNFNPYFEDPLSGNGDSNAVEQNPLYALILTPTRELAVQVKDHLVAIAKYTNIKVATVFGGLAQVKQERILKKNPEIVVATPGRLWELISEGNEHLNKIKSISFLVIDEADRMVEKGHFDELKLLLDRINSDPVSKANRQNFVFSATLSLIHELPAYLRGKKQQVSKPTSSQKLQYLIDYLGMSHPKIVDITNVRGTAQLLTECRITCQLEQKDLYLYYFLQRHPGRTIVFCNSIDCVKRLGQLFALLECQPRPLHAQMNQRQRLKNLEKFAASETGLLIATDVAARGLDIPNVQHVIHYQVPRTSENYVHRSGRTARANKEGITVLMMDPKEMNHYIKMCRTLGKAEDLPLFPISDRYLKAVKSRVALAREIDLLELKVRRTQSDIGWLKKSIKEMDIVVDDMSDISENELYDSDDGGERHKGRKELKRKREALTKLLAKPIFSKGFSYKYPTSSGHLEIPLIDVENNKENAVEVMKTAMEMSKKPTKKIVVNKQK